MGMLSVIVCLQFGTLVATVRFKEPGDVHITVPEPSISP